MWISRGQTQVDMAKTHCLYLINHFFCFFSFLSLFPSFSIPESSVKSNWRIDSDPDQTVRVECWILQSFSSVLFSLDPHARHIFPLAHLAPNWYPKMIYLLWQEARRRVASTSLSFPFTFFFLIVKATHSFWGTHRKRKILGRNKYFLWISFGNHLCQPVVIIFWNHWRVLSARACSVAKLLLELSVIRESPWAQAGVEPTWSPDPVSWKLG